MDHRYDTIVIGAGLAGLTTTVRLASAGRRVLLLERHSELGGRARTDDLDGFLFNQGAHALYRNGIGHRTLQELGVEPAGEPAPIAGAHLSDGNTTTPLPVDARAIVRTKALTLAGKLQFAKIMATIGRLDPADFADISVDEWLAQYRPDVQRLLKAVVRLATYAADTDVLSADAAVSQIAASEHGVLYLDGGWATLCRHLRARALEAGADVRSGVTVDSVGPTDGGVAVTAGTERFEASTAVVAAGGPALTARLVGMETDELGIVGPPATAAALDLALDAAPSRHRFVLGLDEPVYFSVHSPPAAMAPEGKVAAVAMRYLAGDDEGSADEHRASLDHVADLAGVGMPLRTRFLRRMTVIQAIPIAATGGMAGRVAIDAVPTPGVFIAGDWVGSRGILADTAIASGWDAAAAVEHHLGATAATLA